MDYKSMTIEELNDENIRLGNQPDYGSDKVRSERLKINEIISRKLEERQAELRQQEERGEIPPGQTVRL